MTANTQLMLISSSYVFDNKEYLGFCQDELGEFLSDVKRLLFVPFAYTQHTEYTELVQKTVGRLGVEVTGAHRLDLRNANYLVKQFDAVFCGGGNTFLLLHKLYETGLIWMIPEAVEKGVRYMGSSAGANVACPTIGTTNDMPIVEPASLKACGLIPFNINPHYYERPENFKHMGETRRDRIREFLTHNDTDVLALLEGAIVFVEDGGARMAGRSGGIVFSLDSARQVLNERKVAPGDSLSFLLK